MHEEALYPSNVTLLLLYIAVFTQNV